MKYLVVLLSVLLLACSNKPKTVFDPSARPPIQVNPNVSEPDPSPYAGVVETRQVQTPDWVATIAVATPSMTLDAPRFDLDLSQTVIEKIEAALLTTGRFQVAERSRLEAVKKEVVQNNNPDWFNPAYATRVGKFMGAKFLVLPSISASVGPMTTTFELQIKMLETETGTMVHSYTVRTASSSLNINASIRTCVSGLQHKIEEEVRRDFPARGVIVRVTGRQRDIVWMDTRQAAFIRPGMALRILLLEEVFNPVARTKGTFSSYVGEAMVLTVENNGITARIKSKNTDVLPGMIAEVKL